MYSVMHCRCVHYRLRYSNMSENIDTLPGNSCAETSQDTVAGDIYHNKRYRPADVKDLPEDDFDSEHSVAKYTECPYLICDGVDLKNLKDLLITSDATEGGQMMCHPRYWVSLKKGYLYYPKTFKECGTGARSCPQVGLDNLLEYFVTKVKDNKVGIPELEYPDSINAKHSSGKTSPVPSNGTIGPLLRRYIITWQRYRLKVILAHFSKLNSLLSHGYHRAQIYNISNVWFQI